MPTDITDIKLKFNCTANWDDMQQLTDCRFCTYCQKKVYDFTGSTQEELEKVLSANNNVVCGRFTSSQVRPASVIKSWGKRWISAAVLLLGFNFWAGTAVAEKVKHKHKKTRQIKFLPPPKVVTGDIEIRPTSQNLRQQPDSMNKGKQ